MIAVVRRIIRISLVSQIKQNFNKFMDDEPEAKTIKAVSAKEIKKLVRPEFQSHPEKYYPVETLKKLGFSRNQCACGSFYWRCDQNQANCGDSNCVGSYTFIGKGTGIGRQGKKLTYGQAYRTFEKSLTSASIPCTAIKRYPVVARWRSDVDYVAAGIFCFQPYCVTGQLDPPANPLICPQFCVRFNDLDNIGLTGRHYSGFVMLGIQVFNYPGNYKFFKDQCVEFNFRWLTEELGIDPKEITFVEDVWAGGGNLGPSIEYFVGGLQVGNMVFMQYRYFPDATYKQLQIKVIDTGIGLQRIPWLINGSPTSYFDVFPSALQFLSGKLNIPLSSDVWQKLGPYSCLLNVDEAEDIGKVWIQIAEKIGLSVQEVQKAIEPVRELLVILDHTRTVLVVVCDGSLPSNVGGGSNCRNILRRVFALLKKNDWWKLLGDMDGFMELMQKQKKDLAELYGPMQEYSSFQTILRSEHERWKNTDVVQKQKLQKMLAKKPKLVLDDWILAMQTWGLPADAISQIAKQPIPPTLYYQIALRQQTTAKATELILYETAFYPETVNLYYKNHRQLKFDSKVLAVLQNKSDNKLGNNVVILQQSAFYPTSGGQHHDIGTLSIGGEVIKVVNVEKVGKTFLHFLEKEPTCKQPGTAVQGVIDQQRRNTLRCFHTGTHIIFAACRRILGPHIWQAGAKKTMSGAHLDITHFNSLTKEQQMAIENEANRLVLSGRPINKYFMDKAEAELKYGFHLYQGGVIPGNSLRIVDIDGVDTQACCGTHCDSTSQVGWIKLIKTGRISDGILRLSYVAGQRVIPHLNSQGQIISSLNKLWGISQAEIVDTAERIFKDYKKYQGQAMRQKQTIMRLQIECVGGQASNRLVIRSQQKQPTIYFSEAPKIIGSLFQRGKSVLFLSESFFFGLFIDKKHLDLQQLRAILEQDNTPQDVKKKTLVRQNLVAGGDKDKKKKDKKEKVVYKDSMQISFTGNFKVKKIEKALVDLGFGLIED